MKNKTTILGIIGGLILLLAVGLSVYFANYYKRLNHVPLPQLTKTVTRDNAEVELVTTEGNIKIKLFPKLAPKASENFLTLAKEGYYKNNEFFRVVNNFMIQTGSKDNATSGDSRSIFGKPFPNEISDQLYNIRGAVTLANSGTDGTNGSQFFIVQNPKNAQTTQDPTTGQPTKIDKSQYPDKIYEAYKHGGYPALDGQYTVFGQVISGMDVVDKIAKAKVTNAATDPNTGQAEKSKPVHPVKITEVKILKSWNFKN